MKLLSLVSVMFLAGCASWLSDPAETLVSTSRCCSAYNQMQYVQTDSNIPIAIVIDENSPSFNFDQGASFFHATEITGDNRHFLVRSFFSGKKRRVVASPVLLELDANFNVLSQSEPTLHYSASPRYEAPHMQAKIALQEETRFLIVYPSADKEKQQIKTVHNPPQSTGSAGKDRLGYQVYPGNTTKDVLKKALTGKIELIPISEQI